MFTLICISGDAPELIERFHDITRDFHETYLMASRDLAESGFYEEAVKLLSMYPGDRPMIHYYSGAYLKKLGGQKTKESSGKPGFGDSAMVAMFIGLVSAYIGSYIGGFVSGQGVLTFRGDLTPIIVAAVSALVMACFIYLSEKKHLVWLESFSIAGSMLVGMLAAILI